MVLEITPNSFENGSNCAVPSTFTPFAPFNLFIILSNLSASTKALQVMVLVPSYKSNMTKNLPDFNSLLLGLSSCLMISPSNKTFPLSTDKSAIFAGSPLNFILLP